MKIPPFCHRFLHDAESLWWIALYCLATTEPGKSLPISSDVHKKLASGWFPKFVEDRQWPASNPFYMRSLLHNSQSHIPHSYLPIFDFVAGVWLEGFKNHYKSYWVKADGKSDLAIFEQIHMVFFNLCSKQHNVGSPGCYAPWANKTSGWTCLFCVIQY